MAIGGAVGGVITSTIKATEAGISRNVVKNKVLFPHPYGESMGSAGAWCMVPLVPLVPEQCMSSVQWKLRAPVDDVARICS